MALRCRYSLDSLSVCIQKKTKDIHLELLIEELSFLFKQNSFFSNLKPFKTAVQRTKVANFFSFSSYSKNFFTYKVNRKILFNFAIYIQSVQWRTIENWKNLKKVDFTVETFFKKVGFTAWQLFWEKFVSRFKKVTSLDAPSKRLTNSIINYFNWKNSSNFEKKLGKSGKRFKVFTQVPPRE